LQGQSGDFDVIAVPEVLSDWVLGAAAPEYRRMVQRFERDMVGTVLVLRLSSLPVARTVYRGRDRRCFVECGDEPDPWYLVNVERIEPVLYSISKDLTWNGNPPPNLHKQLAVTPEAASFTIAK
jgi:hypothetical protein